MSAPIREFDVSGVAAPFYVLRAKQVLDQMAVGQILALTTDAPMRPGKFAVWSSTSGISWFLVRRRAAVIDS